MTSSYILLSPPPSFKNGVEFWKDHFDYIVKKGHKNEAITKEKIARNVSGKADWRASDRYL